MSERTGESAATTAAEARPLRTIGRRIGLPSGRAIVGALLVTVAVVGLFAAFRRSQADTGSPYVVVAATVPAGQRIVEADLAIRSLDIGELADRTLTSKSEAIGAVAVQTLLPGQLLQRANILTPRDDATSDLSAFEVTFSIDRSRALGGTLVPGELVDVVATLESAGTSCATVVVPKARVVQTGSTSNEVISSRDEFAVTLAVQEDESVLGLVFAVDEADITIVRSTRVQQNTLDGVFCGDSALDAPAPQASE